jgi:hypothetical protein
VADNLFDYIGQQKDLSGLQDWAAAQAANGQLPQYLSDLAQNSPRTFQAMFPTIMQQQMGQQAITQLYGGGSQQQPQQPQSQATSPLAQYGSQGDQDPNAPVPQILPQNGGSALGQIAQPQSPVASSSSGLPDQQRMRALTAINGGDAAKALAMARSMAVPPGSPAPPEGQRYDQNGNLQMIPGGVTKGQAEQDTNFAQSWQTYNNAGGAQRTQNALDMVDKTIADLKSGNLTTGGIIDRLALDKGEPSEIGKVLDPSVLVARNNIASAILPQAKSLFGSRVTNFDAQSLVSSQGLDPMASTDTNIQKLQKLKESIVAGQNDLQNSGSYYQQHGTLSGYQKPQSAQSSALSQVSQQGTIPSGKVYVNPQTGARITKSNGQWVPVQ